LIKRATWLSEFAEAGGGWGESVGRDTHDPGGRGVGKKRKEKKKGQGVRHPLTFVYWFIDFFRATLTIYSVSIFAFTYQLWAKREFSWVLYREKS
jgi:hypothetical protein